MPDPDTPRTKAGRSRPAGVRGRLQWTEGRLLDTLFSGLVPSEE